MSQALHIPCIPVFVVEWLKMLSGDPGMELSLSFACCLLYPGKAERLE